MFGFGNKWKHLPQLPCPRSHEGLPYHLMSDAFKKEVDATHWRDDGTCSYCGSINPEQLFKAIDDGFRDRTHRQGITKIYSTWTIGPSS